MIRPIIFERSIIARFPELRSRIVPSLDGKLFTLDIPETKQNCEFFGEILLHLADLNGSCVSIVDLKPKGLGKGSFHVNLTN
jgi:hypothetical protein